MIALQIAIWPLRGLDRWLLVQHPLTWRARVHIVLWLALITNSAIVAAFATIPLAFTYLFSTSVYSFYQIVMLALGFVAVAAWSVDQYRARLPQLSIRRIAVVALTNLLITTTILYSGFISFTTISMLRMAATATISKVYEDRITLEQSAESQSDSLSVAEARVATDYSINTQSRPEFRKLLEDRLSQVENAHEFLTLQSFLTAERARSLLNAILVSLLVTLAQTAIFCHQSSLEQRLLIGDYLPVRYGNLVVNRIARQAWRPFHFTDQWLLANHPLTWAVQPHIVLPLLCGISLLFGSLHLILGQATQQTDSALGTSILLLNFAVFVLWSFLNRRRNLNPKNMIEHLYVIGVFALAGALTYAMTIAVWHGSFPGIDLNNSYRPFLLSVCTMITLTFVYLTASISIRTTTFAMLLAGTLMCYSLFILPFLILFNLLTRFAGGFVAALYFFSSISATFMLTDLFDDTLPKHFAFALALILFYFVVSIPAIRRLIAARTSPSQ